MHSQPQTDKLRATITHKNLRWIPVVWQEAEHGPRKEGSKDCDRILSQRPANDSHEESRNPYHAGCQPTHPSTTVESVQHTNQPDPPKQAGRHTQSRYGRQLTSGRADTKR